MCDIHPLVEIFAADVRKAVLDTLDEVYERAEKIASKNKHLVTVDPEQVEQMFWREIQEMMKNEYWPSDSAHETNEIYSPVLFLVD